jgi:hypothetical protein
MTYRSPENNLTMIDDKLVLVVPKSQTHEYDFGTCFSYRMPTRVVIDVPVEIKKILLPTLKELAFLVGVRNYSKMKKAELVSILQDRIIFT